VHYYLYIPELMLILKNFRCLISVGLLNTLKHECGHCDNLCEDIAYHYQTTTSSLQNASYLWKDVDTKKTNMTVPKWYNKKLILSCVSTVLSQIICFRNDRADNKMSIVHLYFGADTTVPKLRQRMYDDVDLIGGCLIAIQRRII